MTLAQLQMAQKSWDAAEALLSKVKAMQTRSSGLSADLHTAIRLLTVRP